MNNSVSDNLDRRINRLLDGELTDQERADLQRELLRNPAAGSLMEQYTRQDDLCRRAVETALEPIAGAQPSREGVKVRESHEFQAPSGDSIAGIVLKMGSSDKRTARCAMRRFIGLANTCRQSLIKFLHKVAFAKGVQGPQRECLLESAVRPFRQTARVAAYSQQQEKVLPEEAIVWIEHPTTVLNTFVSSPNRTILVAEIDCKSVGTTKRFGAFWLRLDGQHHVICISSDQHGIDRSDSFVHEIIHVEDGSFWFQPTLEAPEPPQKGEDAMAAEPTDNRPEEDLAHDAVLYVHAQMDVDEDIKRLVGKWISQHLRLNNGAGLVIDAGSSCLFAWDVILKQISRGELMHLTAYTNNYLVLDHWWKNVSNRYVSKTNVAVMGDVLDIDHMAFLPSGPAANFMADSFRATNVYVGTSGIEFDPHQGRILSTYHAGDPERIIKESLFTCDANRRIILATPGRIGAASGRCFDILNIDNLNIKSPIYLITASPEKDTVAEATFKLAKKAFLSPAIEEKIREKNLVFHWITIDRLNHDAPTMTEHLAVPKDAPII